MYRWTVDYRVQLIVVDDIKTLTIQSSIAFIRIVVGSVVVCKRPNRPETFFVEKSDLLHLVEELSLRRQVARFESMHTTR